MLQKKNGNGEKGRSENEKGGITCVCIHVGTRSTDSVVDINYVIVARILCADENGSRLTITSCPDANSPE